MTNVRELANELGIDRGNITRMIRSQQPATELRPVMTPRGPQDALFVDTRWANKLRERYRAARRNA